MPIEKLDVNADGDLIASSGHDNKVGVSLSFGCVRKFRLNVN